MKSWLKAVVDVDFREGLVVRKRKSHGWSLALVKRACLQVYFFMYVPTSSVCPRYHHRSRDATLSLSVVRRHASRIVYFTYLVANDDVSKNRAVVRGPWKNEYNVVRIGERP